MEWGPTAGRRTSNTLRPIVGDEAVNAEDHTTICGEEEPAYMRNKTEYAQRERQRGREIDRMHHKCIGLQYDPIRTYSRIPQDEHMTQDANEYEQNKNENARTPREIQQISMFNKNTERGYNRTRPVTSFELYTCRDTDIDEPMVRSTCFLREQRPHLPSPKHRTETKNSELKPTTIPLPKTDTPSSSPCPPFIAQRERERSCTSNCLRQPLSVLDPPLYLLHQSLSSLSPSCEFKVPNKTFLPSTQQHITI